MGLSALDSFTKPAADLCINTAFSGVLTLFSAAIILSLFFSELGFFMEVHLKEEMVVDTRPPPDAESGVNEEAQLVDIFLNVSFPHIPCELLELTAVDTKSRSNMLSFVKPHRLPKGSHTDVHWGRTGRMKARARRKPHAEMFKLSLDAPDDSHGLNSYDGCRLEVFFLVPKRAGHLTVSVRDTGAAPGMNTPVYHGSRQLLPEALFLNWSHRVDVLTMGPELPGDGSVHNNVALTDKPNRHLHRGPIGPSGYPPMRYVYHLKGIPTEYYPLSKAAPVHSYQVSVLESSKILDMPASSHVSHPAESPMGSSPGLHLSYSFTPFVVRVHETRRDLWEFVTKSFATLGGILAFSGLLDTVVFEISEHSWWFRRKSILG
ncbi:unnamed protein product [Vitrella brassicaformis CCMP3155]|uniref:Endoplasmic reticulum vesicle transporter C-terminal domain-containing protein n=2 Tax=Vitrella brassicaformis TaxID=1169539 RepID=A0A0G4GK43_VITBC|nr:unnamed protein product [Vitrella brassicaformis CCMP3155]|mmetsp:Transcript_40063/g.100243  ORF Transcript_40063/g.100243 Transcript_40063/m.100243 type:complete len:376 (+) Transcript_40063:61-1188(+)|eukprot:CEM30308.1 unnamed protein product [Vitrella brassicaformis CCMP3155]